MSIRFITAIASVATIGLFAVAEATEITATAGDARLRTVVDVQTKEVEDPMASVDFVDLVDCNEDGIDDATELAEGAPDSNGDGTVDDCEFAGGDLNLDMVIDGRDLFIVFGWWASPFPRYGDLNSDGVVDAGDTGLLLVRWGPTPF